MHPSRDGKFLGKKISMPSPMWTGLLAERVRKPTPYGPLDVEKSKSRTLKKEPLKARAPDSASSSSTRAMGDGSRSTAPTTSASCESAEAHVE